MDSSDVALPDLAHLEGLCGAESGAWICEQGDGVVPVSSQLGAPYGIELPSHGMCGGGDRMFEAAAHDEAVRDAVWPLSWGPPEDGPSPMTLDWCQRDADVGDQLKCWLGVGGPSCGGEDSCGPATASAFELEDLGVGDFDGDGYWLYDAVLADAAWAALNPRDCDDTLAAAYPGAIEVCDGLDNDCSGVVDDGLDCLEDLDGDGFAPYGGDCDDGDGSRYPGAPEAPCDHVDNDCNGLVDDGLGCTDDVDGDGFTIYDGDCDDLDAGTYPGAPELCSGLDEDCDGTLAAEEADADGDGWRLCEGDCDEADNTVFPGALELCDDVDSDCDGDFDDGDGDFDEDGVPDCTDDDADDDGDPNDTDCEDLNASVYTGAPEYCDELDSDCDGSLADGFQNFDGDAEPDCIDEDDDGDGDPDVTDCDDHNVTVHAAAAESCDAVDSNCDLDLVDGFPNLDGDAEPDCIDEDDDGDGDPDVTDCDDLDDTVFAGATELCDGLDSDCDGDRVDGFANGDGDSLPDCVDPDDDNDGDPDTSDCAPDDPTRYQGAPEVCDGVDQDCDGVPDNGALNSYWRDADEDGSGDPADSATGCTAPGGYVDNDEDCDDTAFWIAPGLSMVGLTELYSATNQDHLTTRLNGAEHVSLTGAGDYCDVPISQGNCAGVPHIVGYVIDTFPHHMRGADAQTPGGEADLANWAPLGRAWSTNWADHILHAEGDPPPNAGPHAHGCLQICPNYTADEVALGWIRSGDAGPSTREWYRVFRDAGKSHRMTDSATERDSLIAGNWVDDESPGWIFNSPVSCP